MSALKAIPQPHRVPPHRQLEAPFTTFATMLQSNLRRLEELEIKLPPWLYLDAPYARVDQSKLSAQERERFLCALDTLIQNGEYGKLVDIHAEMHMQHTNERLLPWHRVFLLQLEIALRAIHPDVSIPFWDWTQADEQGIPAWLQSVKPTVTTPTRTITVIRGANSSQDLATIASNVPNALQMTDFNNFSALINGVHGSVHIWVGGTMSDPSTAAADPIFFMHHANLDRIWWKWHASPQGQGKNPPLVGADAVMDPWAYTEPETRDIAALGYSYS